MSKIKRVYIAGPLTPHGKWNPNPAIDYLANVRNMIRASLDVLFAGFVPFCPALDFQLFLQLQEGEEITEEMIKRYSIDWLEACDAMVLMPGWEDSRGTLLEIEFCNRHGIPVFESVADLSAGNKQTLILVRGKGIPVEWISKDLREGYLRRRLSKNDYNIQWLK